MGILLYRFTGLIDSCNRKMYSYIRKNDQGGENKEDEHGIAKICQKPGFIAVLCFPLIIPFLLIATLGVFLCLATVFGIVFPIATAIAICLTLASTIANLIGKTLNWLKSMIVNIRQGIKYIFIEIWQGVSSMFNI
jgi:hypothetical protein